VLYNLELQRELPQKRNFAVTKISSQKYLLSYIGVQFQIKWIIFPGNMIPNTNRSSVLFASFLIAGSSGLHPTDPHLNDVLHKSLPTVCVHMRMLLVNGSVKNVTAATNRQATIEELLDASTSAVLMLTN
jgi:hypothetical protein